jgi:hypothetical protein
MVHAVNNDRYRSKDHERPGHRSRTEFTQAGYQGFNEALTPRFDVAGPALDEEAGYGNGIDAAP